MDVGSNQVPGFFNKFEVVRYLQLGTFKIVHVSDLNEPLSRTFFG